MRKIKRIGGWLLNRMKKAMGILQKERPVYLHPFFADDSIYVEYFKSPIFKKLEWVWKVKLR